jgi:UDP-N-acetylmuramoyl-L-alanyl-D-glutamate--2,6-diaminopimelate ligase
VRLSELLAGHDHQVLQGDPDTPITAGACFDVDRVTPGSLFIAVPDHREGGPESIIGHDQTPENKTFLTR